ncbi:MAG TPA: hypothetical protein VJN01_14015 [Xanthomonadales bacterium]|nr:hypothetical protein [Xanthomonadales bacterium]
MRVTTRPALFICALMTWITPAAANEFEQVWTCKIQPGHSLDEVRSVGTGWLQAARSMPGGKGLQLVIRWPIAVPDSAEAFEFVIRAPSLQAWGKFYDTYDADSPVGKADEVFAKVASCSGSTVWESISLEKK